MAPAKRILLAYTTHMGSTVHVANAIAEELEKEGSPVDIKRVEEVNTLDGYSAAIIGGPVIMGWHRQAIKFIKKYNKQLAAIPVAYFFTAKSLTKLGTQRIESVSIQVDPLLAKPPKNSGRLSFRENYATVQNYLWPALKAAPLVRPFAAGFFGGILNMGNMKWYEILFVLLFVQAKPGGEHNFPFIRKWTEELREEISKRETR
jgi:menaquinone-dependent protoporphyrinogen IX oxidase